MEQSILDGNKLIANFMGWEVSTKGKDWLRHDIPCGYIKIHPECLKFHSSWDWLMPVVEKCIHSPHREGMRRHVESIEQSLNSADIEYVYPAVVKFIKWYNKENT